LSDIRLIALDLDGTLLNPRNQVSDADAQAVSDAIAAGVQVVLATSRWHSASRRTALALGIDGPIISHNGALVRWRDGDRTLLHQTIDLALAGEIACHLDGLPDEAYLTVGDQTYLKTRRVPGGGRTVNDLSFVDGLRGYLTAAPTAFLIFGQQAVKSTLELFAQHHGREINLAEGFSESFPTYLNIVHALADKGAALRSVCQALAIPTAATMAVGDAGPDVAMIESAGVGVAMGNAPDFVKAAAAAVAPPNDQDGVAWAIRKYVLG
jgi:Cof subfamily protein (haloacid dehalogenase superfamily)